MSNHGKRTRWQITSATAPTERTNEQRLDDMLQFATEITQWSWAPPRNPQDARERRVATIYLLGIIGVAAAGMTEAFRAERPSIPWKQVLAMQVFVGQPDRLLDHDAVERALIETVPVLLTELTKLKADRP